VADRVSELVGDRDAELAIGVGRAGPGQVADEAGVQGAEAVRLTGPLGTAEQRLQRER
jgi:hypothetical protein